MMILTMLFAAGCQPKVNVNIGPTDGKLRESVVVRESSSAKVALIDVRGLLIDASRPGFPIGVAPNPVDLFQRRLDMAEKDPRVKAVVVRINSPGGTVTASDIMYAELRAFSKRTGKPVVASMGEIATSGGYYLALGADRIVAQPTSITGSIGVILPTFNFSRGMAMIGIESRSVTSGPNKDLASPFEPVRETQYVVLQEMVNNFYGRFRGLVVERRPMLSPDNLPLATDGRIMSGEAALAMGLVDEVGGVREAFAAAKKLAGLETASLIKFSNEDAPARSVYAAGPAAESDPALLRVTVGAAGLPGVQPYETSGFYYLWLPPAP